jgi:NAD(P)-dependent dehydrogenase (short-subunit alcohol dehydrogenase family)
MPLSVIEMDVTSDESVCEAVKQLLHNEGRVDVVVNNAGSSAAGPMEAFSIAQMAALLDVNVLGPMRVNKAVLPGMRERGSGLILWISSTLGRVLPGGGGLYPATKWAVEGFGETLRYEVAPFGVDVVIVEPGAFPTPSVHHSIQAADQAIAAVYSALPRRALNTQADAAYKLPDPQEVADAVLELMQLPAGQRPLRHVVGPIFTEGVPEYNRAYEALRTHMEEVLKRPDQAITWTPSARR